MGANKKGSFYYCQIRYIMHTHKEIIYMKVRKLFGIALLAGSLLLTSCDELINNFMGGNKKKSSEETSQNNGAGYQGKQGATELSKEEWELAFSLEEFALRRNCHLQVTQDEREMNLDVDNGKFKIDVPTYSQYPFYMHFTGMSGDDIQGVQYYPNDDGTYSIHEDQEKLNLVMAEFGLIYLKYNSFTYDSSSKMYKADNYHYEITYQGRTALSLVCEDCEVTIEDGFPKKLACTIVEGADADRSGVHYEANYSRYNAVNVEIPTNGNGGNNGGNGGNANASFPKFNGTEISYEQFYNKFVERAKPGYQSVLITANMEVGGDRQTATLSASLVDGSWVIDGVDSEELSVENFIISGEMMTELGEEINDPNNNAEIKIYSDNDNPGYFVMTMSESALNPETGATMEVAIQYHLNQYFYATAQYVYGDGAFESVEIQWKY